MRLRNRLERLEDLLMVSPENGDKQIGEYVRSWMDNDVQATTLFKDFEDYCRKSGHPYDPRTKWVELTRTDTVAAELARKYLESYRNYVLTHFGVKVEALNANTGRGLR